MAGSGRQSDFGVAVVKRTASWGQNFTISGWGAVQRALGLQSGNRVQLDPISRDPWHLRLSLLPAVADGADPPR